jgi:crotonobetainyl-CoA hydratase
MDRPLMAGDRLPFTALVVTRDGPVTRIKLNRPERLNAITPEMHHELQAAIDGFAEDDAQRICVITGAGRGFCSGSDLHAMAERERAGAGPAALPRSGYAGLIERFDLDKPLIAAVNGVAAGGGFEIALACDLIIASDTARFGLPEPHVGLVAIGGGPHRLARQIGLKHALGMVLTGRFVDADEARSLGFVNEVVPAAALDAAVDRWVQAILRGGPAAIRAAKQLVQHGLDEPTLAVALARQDNYPSMVAWRGSDERERGVRAFAEKRPPDWSTS